MTTTTTHPLAAFARTIFSEVTHVDECGAPVLDPHARDLGICENDMPGDTPVGVWNRSQRITKDRTLHGGPMTRMPLALALRDMERGILDRIGAHAFVLRTDALDRADGPGLTPAQARRRHLAKASR